ncbi:MAG: hypothetical protein GXY33_11705 [Phycisphaerae bacterium]|nr:hypothetical protein [Phycisphaerae bacterium]
MGRLSIILVCAGMVGLLIGSLVIAQQQGTTEDPNQPQEQQAQQGQQAQEQTPQEQPQGESPIARQAAQQQDQQQAQPQAQAQPRDQQTSQRLVERYQSRLDRLPERLNLNEEQRNQFQSLRQTHMERIRSLVSQIDQATNELRTQLANLAQDDPTRQRIQNMRLSFFAVAMPGGAEARFDYGPRTIAQTLRRVDLPPDKQQQVRDILDQSRQKYHQYMRQECQQRMTAQQDMMDQIREVLDEQELQQFQQTASRLERQQQYAGRGPGGRDFRQTQQRGRPGQFQDQRGPSGQYRQRQYAPGGPQGGDFGFDQDGYDYRESQEQDQGENWWDWEDQENMRE